LSKHSDEISYFDAENFADVGGKMALAFHVHNLLINLCSNTKKMSDNPKIVVIAFFFTFFTYISIGLCGGLGIIGRTKHGSGNLVFAFFPKDSVLAFSMECIFLLNLVTNIPFFVYFSKDQFFDLLNKALKREKHTFFENLCFNIVTTATFILLGIFNISPSLIMGLAGSLICFWNIYLFPALVYFNDDKLVSHKVTYLAMNDSGLGSEDLDMRENLIP